MKRNSGRLGARGEEFAAEYLRKLKYRILEKNYRCSLGEIDLVCRQGKRIVFVEVKTRTSSDFGMPEEAVTEAKKRKIFRLAEWYLAEKHLENREVSFEVLSLFPAREGAGFHVERFPNAFELT
ncbi:MAG TPA: YraN family protein [Candidatus Omnitrophota bacterium]|nr:YraN family protein [Candidatus Omnitrophota bacterium]